MSNTTFTVAVIGCGDMGQAHAKAWAARDDCQLGLVVDANKLRANATAADYNCTAAHAWEEVLQQDNIDIVSICVPVCYHAPIAIAALAAGKHVLCEKPMALSESEANNMIAAAAKHQRTLAISYQYRGHSRVQQIKELIDQGSLCGPLNFRFADCREVRPKLAMHDRQLNGGPVHDMAGHFFDLVSYFTGEHPCQIDASGGVAGADKARLASVQELGIDHAHILARYPSGHSCSIHINWALPEGTPTMTDATVSSASGWACFDDAKQFISATATGLQTIELTPDPEGPSVRIADLLTAIRNERQPEVDGQAGFDALHATMTALRIIDHQHATTLPLPSTSTSTST